MSEYPNIDKPVNQKALCKILDRYNKEDSLNNRSNLVGIIMAFQYRTKRNLERLSDKEFDCFIRKPHRLNMLTDKF